MATSTRIRRAERGSDWPATRASSGCVLERLPMLDGARPIDVAESFRDLPGLALLESARPGRRARWSYLSADPIKVLEGRSDGIDPFADARLMLSRLHPGMPPPPVDQDADSDVPLESDADLPPFAGGLIGYLGYDLGHTLERLPTIAPDDQRLPLLRLALHDWVVAFDGRTGGTWLAGRSVDADPAVLERRLEMVRDRLSADVPPGVGPGQKASSAMHRDGMAFLSNLDRPGFEARVEAILAAIANGDLYQANLARRLTTPFKGDPWPLYRTLRTGDPALFAAYLDLGPADALVSKAGHAQSPLGSRAIVSASPEPFLAVDGSGHVSTDPIKGTRPRGRMPAEDRALAAELLASGKDRAENVMIVDVLRNDLGRVCRPGTVRVPRLCRLERTTTVQHLVSTVTGQLGAGRDAFDLLAAAFPGGSITGAPKIRAMELLEELEPVRRGPYTGAAVWIGADGAMGSSILIRTFVADGERLSLHVGGGITWRSDPGAEWDETVVKARGPLQAIGATELG